MNALRYKQMPQKPDYPLKVFYDGSCYVCATEMLFYMRKDHGGRLVFIDISDAEFNPDNYGIKLEDFMSQMHTIDQAGRIYRGPEAFRAIWQAFPSSAWYGLLATLVTVPGISILAGAAYLAFARTRKYIPKHRKAVCKTGKRPPS
jgi:predicted DCC family thiol-disulfide oxidoreductase YuxK